MGPLFRALGGYPVDRGKGTDVVSQLVTLFESEEKVCVGFPPEGTRSKVERYKTGYLRAAYAANVPVFICAFDGPNKRVVLDKLLDASKRNWAVFIGSVIPDLAIYLWAPYQYFVNDVSGKELWGELYFAPPMQNLIAYFNSIPIYAALALIGWIARGKIWGKLMFFFALAALIHMATDMPVHADDAYRHLWPITDWRFYSPPNFANSQTKYVFLENIQTIFYKP